MKVPWSWNCDYNYVYPDSSRNRKKIIGYHFQISHNYLSVIEQHYWSNEWNDFPFDRFGSSQMRFGCTPLYKNKFMYWCYLKKKQSISWLTKHQTLMSNFRLLIKNGFSMYFCTTKALALMIDFYDLRGDNLFGLFMILSSTLSWSSSLILAWSLSFLKLFSSRPY